MAGRVKVRMELKDVERVRKTMAKLPENMQRKVLVQASSRTVKNVVRPLVIDNINARSFDPPVLRARRGVGKPMQSHTKAPGILKKMMGTNVTKRVKAMKRSRVAVGHFLKTPTRDELGIPDDSDYKMYYPAALEFQKSPMGNAPRPFMRGTFRSHQKTIVRQFSVIAKSRLDHLKAKGRL